MGIVERDEQFMRQKDFLPHNLWDDVRIHFVGVGGIGSAAAFVLGKIGARKINLYDPDTIERHNISNQMLSATEDKIGLPKVADLGGILLDLCNDEIDVKAYKRKVDEQLGFVFEQGERNIVICGPDNMKTRKFVWELVKGNENVICYIDGRMATRIFKLYSIDPNDAESYESYEKTLHSDEDAEPLPCSDRSVFHTNMILASTIAEMVRRFITPDSAPYHQEILFDLINLGWIID